jgi:hypothetical protein
VKSSSSNTFTAIGTIFRSGTFLPYRQEFRRDRLPGKPLVVFLDKSRLLHNLCKGSHALTFFDKRLHGLLDGPFYLLQRLAIAGDVQLRSQRNVEIAFLEELSSLHDSLHSVPSPSSISAPPITAGGRGESCRSSESVPGAEEKRMQELGADP